MSQSHPSEPNPESGETQALVVRFMKVTVLTPLLISCIAYLVFNFTDLEPSGKNIRHLILVIWLGTMLALAVSLWLYLRSTTRSRTPVQVVTRMNWETRQSSRSITEVFYALVAIPCATVVFLSAYHFLWQRFSTAEEIRFLASIVIPLWILAVSVVAYRTKKKRIG